jgi:hypothetical protein
LLGLDKEDGVKLKFNKVLIDFLKALKKQKKILILATGSDQYIADLIGDYVEKYFGLKFAFGVFDCIILVTVDKDDAEAVDD